MSNKSAGEGFAIPYTYPLPKERIAQRPVHPPDAARMLVVDRDTSSLTDSLFSDLPSYLEAADHLVFNDTKVIPARFFGTLPGYDGEVEVLLVDPVSDTCWCCIGKPMRRLREADRISFGNGLYGKRLSSPSHERLVIQFESERGDSPVEAMHALGAMPIPPYIREGKGDEKDRTDYQTIFATQPGSVAAPTASLHFTEDLVKRIKERGCEVSFVTLHVSTASFLPVVVNGEVRPPAAERVHVPPGLLDHLAESKRRGGRVIGVGTTVVRALEGVTASSFDEAGSTNIFITPGFHFRAVDAVITNFHQPGTTHLLLVEALLGRTLLSAAYTHALNGGYRFLSYGDGMLIKKRL